MSAELLDWGEVDYAEATERQRELFERLIAEPKSGSGQIPRRADALARDDGHRADNAGWLILCRHPHVYTLGKSGRSENLLVAEEFLRDKGAALHRTDRGGDITYHGPGQIVGYPILDLDKLGMGLREYIGALEQSVIETVAEFGIEAGRIPGKTGVWVKGGSRPEECSGQIPRRADALARDDGRRAADRKICAIGVRASRGVVMHGLALNVATDLKWFGYINPCGFVGGGVTSMEAELGRRVEMEEVKRVLCLKLFSNLQL